jgi:hypothetical protein
MALLRSTLRPVVASARVGGAPALRRNMTQNSAEAQRYSFKHAVEDITSTGNPKEMATRSLAHAQEVGLRLKHGWFRDGVTHPNSDLPPDGLARMTWNSEAVCPLLPRTRGVETTRPCALHLANRLLHGGSAKVAQGRAPAAHRPRGEQIPKFNAADPFSYTPTQMVGFVLGIFGAIGFAASKAAGASSVRRGRVSVHRTRGLAPCQARDPILWRRTPPSRPSSARRMPRRKRRGACRRLRGARLACQGARQAGACLAGLAWLAGLPCKACGKRSPPLGWLCRGAVVASGRLCNS